MFFSLNFKAYSLKNYLDNVPLLEMKPQCKLQSYRNLATNRSWIVISCYLLREKKKRHT